MEVLDLQIKDDFIIFNPINLFIFLHTCFFNAIFSLHFLFLIFSLNFPENQPIGLVLLAYEGGALPGYHHRYMGPTEQAKAKRPPLLKRSMCQRFTITTPPTTL